MGRNGCARALQIFVNFLTASAKQQRERILKFKNFPLSGESERERLIFYIYIFNLTVRSIFSFKIFLTVRNILNDFRVSRDSQVKYTFIV